jgi:hypothetical protein
MARRGASFVSYRYTSFFFYSTQAPVDEDKGTPLTTMCDIFDYTNLVKTATCHTKNANPTLKSSINR